MVGSCDVLGPATGCPACPAHGFRSDSDFTVQLAYFSAQRYGSPNKAIPVLWAGELWVEMLRGEAIDGNRERRSGPDMMRWLRIESVKALVVVLCLSCAAALLGACADTKGGKRYLQDLDALIARTDRIEVVEHSSPFDIAHAATGELRKAKERVYKRVVLTPSQKTSFQSAIGSLDPETQSAFPACIPVSHHRIEFFASSKLIDSMEVCFECGQVEWSGSSATPPSSLYGGLEAFVVSVGMQPKRDWRRLAAGRGQ